MLSNASEMGDNVTKACPSIQWSLLSGLVGTYSNPQHTIYAFSILGQIWYFICRCVQRTEKRSGLDPFKKHCRAPHVLNSLEQYIAEWSSYSTSIQHRYATSWVVSLRLGDEKLFFGLSTTSTLKIRCSGRRKI